MSVGNQTGPEEVVKDLMKMLKNGSQHDVTIVCRDGELKANKDILMARSDYFAKMLSNENFVEGKTDRIEMKNVGKESMEVVLKYLFTGSVGNVNSWVLKFRTMDVLRMLLLRKPFSSLENEILKSLENASLSLDKYSLRIDNEMSRGSYWSGPEPYYRVAKALKLVDLSKLDKLYNVYLSLICKHLNLFNKAWISNAGSLKRLPFHVVKQIMEHPDGRLSWKTKTFNLWFSGNEDSLSGDEKVEILTSFKDIFSDSVGEENKSNGN